ncbi:MAG: hypothetical protein M3R71_04400, partial [Actinomycetota bacterium]|nr:hypothetical protein [Actinomycetota bacterium]
FPLLVPHLPARWASVAYVGTGLGAVSLGRNPNGTIGQLSDAWQKIRPRIGPRIGRPGQGVTAWSLSEPERDSLEGVVSVASSADG